MGRYKDRSPTSTRAQVAWWLAARKPNGSPYIYAEIADEIGVSRERVRTVASEFENTGHWRQNERTRINRLNRITNHRPFSATVVNRWLADAGYRRCGTCLTVQSMEDFRPKHTPANPHRLTTRCRSCVSSQAKERYNDPESGFKEKQLAWKRENRDRCRMHYRKCAKKRRDHRRAAGLCVTCGGERDSEKKNCKSCLAEYRQKYRKMRTLKLGRSGREN